MACYRDVSLLGGWCSVAMHSDSWEAVQDLRRPHDEYCHGTATSRVPLQTAGLSAISWLRDLGACRQKHCWHRVERCGEQLEGAIPSWGSLLWLWVALGQMSKLVSHATSMTGLEASPLATGLLFLSFSSLVLEMSLPNSCMSTWSTCVIWSHGLSHVVRMFLNSFSYFLFFSLKTS